MKRLFDIQCKNRDCSEFEVVHEAFINYEDVPKCSLCNQQMEIVVTKTPSVYLKGGKHAGFYNDGFLNTGKSKSVRRIPPKASRTSNEQ